MRFNYLESEEMQRSRTLSLAGMAAVLLTIAGCAGTRPVPYAGLASSTQLRPNPTDQAGRTPFLYSTGVDWRQYGGAIVEHVTVYGGADHQFEDVAVQDREQLAQYLELQLRNSLARRFTVMNASAPQTIRVKATLTGAKLSTRLVGTALHFDLAGGPYNLVQAIRDEEGALTGSVSYAVEIYDASDNRLLYAYVEKQFPNAWNLKATLGRLDASKVGIDKGAENLMARLN